MSRYKRWLAQAVGVAVMLLAVAYVARPVGHVPPYDANLLRLAESKLQGYCAGETFWQVQTGDAALAAGCRKKRADEMTDVSNLAAVQPAFCQAIVVAGWEGDVPSCLGIMASYKYWPTYDGTLTDQWNRARPYPQPAISGDTDEGGSRTGGRSQAPTRPGDVPRVGGIEFE